MKKEARPFHGRASSVRPVPASGSTVPRLPPRPQDRPPRPPASRVRVAYAAAPSTPRPPVSRVSVDHAAAPAAAPRLPPSTRFPRQCRLCRGSRRGPRIAPVRPVPAPVSTMPRLPPRPQDRPSFARFPRQCRPCRGSRRGPKHPPSAMFPRQCRPCRGSRRGPKQLVPWAAALPPLFHKPAREKKNPAMPFTGLAGLIDRKK